MTSIPSPINLIVNLGGKSSQVDHLKRRLETKSSSLGREVKVLNLTAEDLNRAPTNEERTLFSRITNKSKIYILDHGYSNSKNIQAGSYMTIGDYFGARLNKEAVNNPLSKLKFSLLSCFAGNGINYGESGFGSRLHCYLGQRHGINSEVKGRTRILMAGDLLPKYGKLTATFRHYIEEVTKGVSKDGKAIDFTTLKQVPGTKRTFKWTESGNQIVVDSYIDKIRIKALEVVELANVIPNKKILEEIQPFLDSITKIGSIDLISLEDISAINLELKKIQNLLPEKTEYDSLKSLINKILIKTQKSTGIESTPPHVFKQIIGNVHADAPNVDMENLIQTTIINNTNSKLRSIIKAEEGTTLREKEKLFKQSISPILQALSDAGMSKLLNDLNLTKEQEVVNHLIKLIGLMTSNDYSSANLKILQETLSEIRNINLNPIPGMNIKFNPEAYSILLDTLEKASSEYFRELKPI